MTQQELLDRIAAKKFEIESAQRDLTFLRKQLSPFAPLQPGDVVEAKGKTMRIAAAICKEGHRGDGIEVEYRAVSRLKSGDWSDASRTIYSWDKPVKVSESK